MTETTKSKLSRLAGLSFWLLLVTIGCFFLSFFLFAAWLHLLGHDTSPSPELFSHAMLIGGLVLGYAWIIYRRLSPARAMRQRLLIAIGSGILGAIIAYWGFALLVWLVLGATGTQPV